MLSANLLDVVCEIMLRSMHSTVAPVVYHRKMANFANRLAIPCPCKDASGGATHCCNGM